jgi:hypothetical protein
VSQPFQPTIAQACYGAGHGHFEMPEYAESMFHGILREWERVFWNTRQESFDQHRHEPQTIGAVYFRPYVWDSCDCGGQYPNHAADCRFVTEHKAWNDARLEWAAVPKDQDQIDEEREAVEKAAASGNEMAFMMAAMDASMSQLDMARLASDDYPVPRPPCTCGASDGWEEHDCTDWCVSEQPNFGISGDAVQIRWYKYPGRGMSVNVALDAVGWVAWHDRAMLELRRAECLRSRQSSGWCGHADPCPHAPKDAAQ